MDIYWVRAFNSRAIKLFLVWDSQFHFVERLSAVLQQTLWRHPLYLPSYLHAPDSVLIQCRSAHPWRANERVERDLRIFQRSSSFFIVRRPSFTRTSNLCRHHRHNLSCTDSFTAKILRELTHDHQSDHQPLNVPSSEWVTCCDWMGEASHTLDRDSTNAESFSFLHGYQLWSRQLLVCSESIEHCYSVYPLFGLIEHYLD